MNDEEFIRYCETHCHTERAGFVADNMIRILTLAGDLSAAATWRDCPKGRIVSVHPETMLSICKNARANLREIVHE